MKTSKPQKPDPKEQQGDNKDKNSPSRPGNDPDQTPERETKSPPVAEPEKQDKPGKVGFSDNFLLY
jgi:hypothetical protein